MARVLITGMTSPQSSSRLNARSLSFSGAISRILHEAGHSVELAEPSVFTTAEDLKKFDTVLVGVSPLLSVTSNRAYGALSVIGLLADSDKLRFFIDSSDPAGISASLRAVQKDFSCLTKEFYVKRHEYRDVMSDKKTQERLGAAVSFLSAEIWPITLYPALPWSVDAKIEEKLPSGTSGQIRGAKVDTFYLSREIPRINVEKINRWAIDDHRTKWSISTTSTLRLPHVLMKENKGSTDITVFERIASSIGALISPAADGELAWSYRWAQSMNANTPIATDWKIASAIGNAWSHLAAGVEEMSHIDRYELSVSQKEEYIKSLPSQDTVKENLTTLLRI